MKEMNIQELNTMKEIINLSRHSLASLKTEESFCFSSALCSYFRAFHPFLNKPFKWLFFAFEIRLTFNLGMLHKAH